jgi:hypothetical protein
MAYGVAENGQVQGEESAFCTVKVVHLTSLAHNKDIGQSHDVSFIMPGYLFTDAVPILSTMLCHAPALTFLITKNL